MTINTITEAIEALERSRSPDWTLESLGKATNDFEDALDFLKRLEAEQKALMVFTTDKGERFSIPGIIVAQPSPASESGQ